MTITQVLQQAEQDPALGKIRLVKLLQAQEGWSPRRAKAAVARTARSVEAGADDLSQLTINWLMDRRTAGRRLLAFVDATRQVDSQPWPGFPHTPMPAHYQEATATWPL